MSTPQDIPTRFFKVLLVAGGQPGHDYDYARLRLLQFLHDRGDVWTRVFSGYPEPESLDDVDLLITYTCQLWPNGAFETALPKFLENGGGWFALHGSNSLGHTGDSALSGRGANYLRMLGTQFRDHPPVLDFVVAAPSDCDHEIVRGLKEFLTVDEFYIMDKHSNYELLLEARLTPEAKQRVLVLTESREVLSPEATSAALYTRRVGHGHVVYCALGHCDRNDGQPIRRCSWDVPAYEDVVRRCLGWFLDGQLVAMTP